MPQTLLPIFSSDSTSVNEIIYVQKKDGMIYYFHGCLPVFSHAEEDLKSFRLITSSLVVNGSCTQMDIVRAFNISKVSMKRYVKKYREGGAEAFFNKPKKRRNPVLKKEVVLRVEELLNEGKSVNDVADELGIRRDTLKKGIKSGRVKITKKKA